MVCDLIQLLLRCKSLLRIYFLNGLEIFQLNLDVNFVFSGEVAQNIKATKLILDSNSVIPYLFHQVLVIVT